MSAIISHWKRHFKSALTHSHRIAQLVAPHTIEDHCRRANHRWRRSFWSPSTTFLTCVLQALNSAKSLRAAVAELLSHISLTHAPSADPSAFAQARQRLPVEVFGAVLEASSRQARALADSDAQRWNGYRVVLIDAACVSMPDTPELQEAFPQPHAQSPGCGFPIARLVAMFDHRSGAVIDHRMGSLHDSEAALFRQMIDQIGPKTIAVADRYYCSYTDIARIVQRDGDVVFRLHKRRPHAWPHQGTLSEHDGLIEWQRPQWFPSCGLTRDELEQLPEHLMLRMVRTSKSPRGFRSREICIVTTILDPQEASADQLLALYRQRWMVELNLRSLKTSMGMEVLHGKSVDVVRKEVMTHLLLYNLIRIIMWEAATLAGRDPQRLSFAGTMHRLHALAGAWLMPRWSRVDADELLLNLLRWIANDHVPDRPDRFEPRRVKRRPKNYSRLTKPRKHYHRHGDPSCR
jgi:hypothetical protein